MIKSYRDKRTRDFAAGRFIKAFQGIKQQAEKRLEILDAAETIRDLAVLPSNRLEKLGRERTGQFSIRINAQYRICFEWANDENDPVNVEITDYH